ncbi:MAG: hypothetical protein Q7S21_00075 [archaeon]|nr:hypothetical protein [archaeon]
MGYLKVGMVWSLLLAIFLFSLAPIQASNTQRDLTNYQQAIVLTNCSNYSCLKEIVQGTRDENQLVSIVFPQHNSFIALIEPQKASSLKQKFSSISSIEFETIPQSQISSLNEQQKFSANIWNKLKENLANPTPQETSFEFNDELIMPEAAREIDVPQAIIGGGNQINWDPSSIYTSEYMIGDVTVAVLMPESNAQSPNTENWTQQEVTDVTAKVTEGLTWWNSRFNEQNFNSNLHLTFQILVYDPFNYPTQMSTSYEPIENSISNQSTIIDQIMANFGYNGSTTGYARQYAFLNNLRNTYGTEWAFIAWTVDSTVGGDFLGGGEANARLGGPRFQSSATYFSFLSNLHMTVSHETGHIFWALDQGAGTCTCTQATGYLNVQNQNCDATPACLTDVPSVMRAGISGIDQYGSWQLGWKDSDVDAIPDVVDYGLPASTLSAYAPDPTSTKTLNYSGNGSVGPAVNNINPFNSPRQDILISDVFVSNGYYRVDAGSWNSQVTASDGVFEEQAEACGFTTYSLPNGLHSIELKIRDSLGQERISTADNVTVLGAVGESCVLSADCLSNVCRPGNGSGKYCVSNTTSCAVSGGEIVSGEIFSKNVVNRLNTQAICYQGFWGEDPLLASPPSTFKEVILTSGFTNTTVSIELPKMAPITNAILFVSNITQSPVNDVMIDVGNDGIDSKNLGTISENNSPKIVDFTTELNQALQNCSSPNILSRGICTVMIGVSSTNSGTIILHGLDVQYNKWLLVEDAGGQGAGFMPSYTYVQDVIIDSTHPAINTDNTFTILLNTASLISQGKLQADCDDLRVFNTVTQTELDRDILNCNSITTSVSWKANQVLGANIADSTTYDLYYGNALADSSFRNLSNVYKLFDDFEDGSISGIWSVDEATESGGTMNVVSDADNDFSGAIVTTINAPYNTFVEASVKSSSNRESGYLGLSDQTNPASFISTPNAGLFQYVGHWVPGSLDGYAGSTGLWNIDTYSANIYKTFKIDYQSTGTTFYSNGTQRATNSNNGAQNTMHPFFDVFCVTGGAGCSNETLSVDWVKVAFYVPLTDVSLGLEALNAPPNAVPVMDEVQDITRVAGQNVEIIYGATDADGDALTYSNSYNLTSSFYSTDWINWNADFTAMNWFAEPYNLWVYNNSMTSGNADAGIYYIVAKVSDGISTVGQIIEINLLPNNSRPTKTPKNVKFACRNGECET